jgi:hypothetical protein
MNDAHRQAAEPREELRRRWLSHAAAAFDLMFHPNHQADLVTFEQRELRALDLGRDLTAWLLQQHANTDSQVRPEESSPPLCPKCGRAGRRVTQPDEPLPRRQVTTLAGEVTLRREKWHCTTCRVVFFPPGRHASPGDRGL